MRAAIYARCSSDLQRDTSIEDQVRICTARIAAEGWTLAETYTDHGSSGASSLQPGYQKLLEDTRGGAVDIVVAEALDRLSRDQEHIAALYKQLGFAGVRLVTLTEGEISELHVGFKGTMNRITCNRDTEIAAHKKELAQVMRKLDTLDDAIAEGFRSDGLQAKLAALESRKKDLERTLSETPPPAPRLHPNLAGLYRCKVERLHEALADPEVRDEALAILRSLIESVVMHPRDGGFTIELVGEIANMVTLALTADSKTAAPHEAAVPDAYRRSVKVVAGAGLDWSRLAAGDGLMPKTPFSYPPPQAGTQ